MKKNFLRRSVAVAAAISLIFSNTASAGTWYQNAGNWFAKDEKSGKNLTGWYQDDKKDWYYLEPSSEGKFNGALRSGWLPSGKDWFFLNPIHDGLFGKMFVNTWVWVDGYCYYFDANGKMISGTKTPDGYMVNKNGQWTENGVVQYVPGKGIITKQSNIDSVSFDSDSTDGNYSGNYSENGNNGGTNNGNHDNNGENSDNTGSDTGKQQVTLTVKYMDADTNEILDMRVLIGKPLEKTEIEQLEFGGYTVCDGQPIQATFAETDREVYVLYRKNIFKGSINIQYIDISNNKFIGQKSVTGRVGDTYIAHIPAFEGYKAITEKEEVLTIDIVKFPYKHEDDPIELTGLTGLKKLYLRGIGTDTIDLTDLEQLEELKLDDIPVKELDFSQCTNLKKLTLIETQVKHLDISNNLKLKPNKLELISNRTWSFTGNGEICPRGSWYKNPYELNPVPVSECARGETIYSRYFWMYYGGGANLKSNAQKDTAMTPSNAMKISD